MTLFLNCQGLSKSFGNRTLFKNLSFSIFSGDRTGFIGPNGAGKTTLLKILAGEESVSEGTISTRRGLKIGYLPQVCECPDLPPAEVLMRAFPENDEREEYEKELLVETWLSKLQFTGDEPSAQHLSGGWKKRLRLAQELMFFPDLLLLDEPTNHLDLEGILWLEKFLPKESPSYLIVSHDRTFLEHMVNRTIEINPLYPLGLFSQEGSYQDFLAHKELFLLGQLEQERSMASRARKELDWLRQSPKARTSKSKSRVDDAHELLENLKEIQHRNREKKAEVDFSSTQRETKKLLVSKNLSKTLGNRLLFSHLDFTLSPFTRMGLMGKNGCGKTTLLRLIAGEIEPDQGTIKKADHLNIVYFDQHRAKLPSYLTLKEALSPNGDFVTFRGQKIHVNGWCKRFLFSPDILDMPLEKLSGGERARIAIAHLMLQPADILLLDEPTNDLDIATLETLEETLLDFPGAVVLITHDRSMMARVCNTLLALDEGKALFFPDFSQWEAALKKRETEKKSSGEAPPKTAVPKKPSSQEKKECDQIEKEILETEKQIQTLNGLLEDPEQAQNIEHLNELCLRIAAAETHLEKLYLRFEELDKSKKEGC